MMRNTHRTQIGIWVAGFSISVFCHIAVVDNAWSQACCTSSGSSDFAVVGRKDIAATAVMVQYDPMLGHFNRNGEYVSVERSVVRDVVFTSGVGLRPVPALKQWQLNLVVPVRYQYRWYDGIEPSKKFGFGDVSLSTRYTVLEDRQTGIQLKDTASFLPYLDVIVGVKSPTGRSPEESVEPSGSDAMGDGSWGVSAGISLQKFITRKNALLFGFNYEMRLPHEISDSAAEGMTSKFDPGDATDYRAVWQYIPDSSWSASLFSSLRVTYPSELDNEVVQHSQILRWRMGAGITWVFVPPKWEASLTGMTDPWWHGGGWNVTAAGPSAMLQVRHNFVAGGKKSVSVASHERAEEPQAPVAFDAPPPIGTSATCPVMKEQFVVAAHTERSEYNGKHYVYCCPGCKSQFDAAPDTYLD